MEPINSKITNILPQNTETTARQSISFGANSRRGDTFERQNAGQSQRRTFFGGIREFFQNVRNAYQEISNRPSEVQGTPAVQESQEVQGTQENSEEIFFRYEEEPKEELPDTEMKRFLESESYEAKIKAATQGKYQDDLMSLLSLKNLGDRPKKELVKSGLTEEQFLDAVKKLSKSTFKVAMNKPVQYINYTQDAGYQSFLASTIITGNHFDNEESRAKGYMLQFFRTNLVKMAIALQYIDTDTLNQMMDKRSASFHLMLDSLSELKPENGELLKELISHANEGDARQKIKMCELVEIFQSNEFDMNLLRDLCKEDTIDTSKLNEIFKEALLKKAGVDKADAKGNVNFNEEYMYLLFSDRAVLNNGVPTYINAFEDLIRESVKGNFENYITDETNRYGAANKNTKMMFKENGLDYEQWFHPKFDKANFDFKGKEMSLKLWDRNPFEDLFIGNKTRCCTAITTGSNSASMPLFLMNTAFNYIELEDQKGETKGMARIYMSNVEDKPSVVIDSIELTDVKQLGDKEKQELAGHIFDYVSKFGETITGKPVKVYYVKSDSGVLPSRQKYQEAKKNKFIGDVSSNRIYSNVDAGCKWDDIRDQRYTHYFEVN